MFIYLIVFLFFFFKIKYTFLNSGRFISAFWNRVLNVLFALCSQSYAAPYYDFAWKVRAGGGYGGGGYGDDGYGKQQQGYGGGEALEFGHQEKRYGDKTEGQWESQLPYGGDVRMVYQVDAQKYNSRGYY
jgi:hypothetical protein